jgi:hypothetical protein
MATLLRLRRDGRPGIAHQCFGVLGGSTAFVGVRLSARQEVL